MLRFGTPQATRHPLIHCRSKKETLLVIIFTSAIHTGNLQCSSLWRSSVRKLNKTEAPLSAHSLISDGLFSYLIFFLRQTLKLYHLPSFSARFHSAWFTSVCLPSAACPKNKQKKRGKELNLLQSSTPTTSHLERREEWGASGERERKKIIDHW